MYDLSLFTNLVAKPECSGLFVGGMRGRGFNLVLSSPSDDGDNFREGAE